MSNQARWTWVIASAAGLGIALVLLFVLAFTGDTPGSYERHFVWLFWVNVAVAALLAVVVGVASVRLLLRIRRKKFGSLLLAKLAAIFALVGLAPGLLIYGVSYQFVSRSIEAWFDVKVARALDAGLALGKGGLDAAVAELTLRTRASAQRLAESNEVPGPLHLERLREQLGVDELAMVGAAGQILLSASTLPSLPERPSPALMRQARQGLQANALEGLDEDAGHQSTSRSAVRARALVAIPRIGSGLGADNIRYLLSSQAVPPTQVAQALAVQAAYSEYQQRAFARDSLRRMYIGTLTLALVLAVFGAVLLAAVLGNQLVRPLLLLADGVRHVADGDLSPKPVFASRDELGGLTRSFADMTAQLAQAREDVQRGVLQLEGAHTRLQTILDNLTGGVVVFTREGFIDTVNPGATRILRVPMSAYIGRALHEVPGLQGFAQAVTERFAQHVARLDDSERDHWQEAFELQPATEQTLTLLVRGAALPNEAQLMVFDDISEVVAAQRAAAWAEVARRLAHEIKNPLTPIQLSAERLRHKLQARLQGADEALLQKSVDTIVNQVQAMKHLVNAFRDYARLPAAHMAALDLNALVGEVLALYGQAQEVGTVHLELEPALPSIQGDAAQLRQVIHNLVQNALDAVAARPAGRVEVSTHSARAEGGSLRAVRLVVQDNGPGFEHHVLARAFEPYVTTKAKGTGLGLAVVKKIADEHRAQIRIANRSPTETTAGKPAGARVSISFSIFPPPTTQAAGSSGSTVNS